MGHLRASPAVVVKITTEKVSISTLATHFLKNTPTILFILLFILFKYYFLIFISSVSISNPHCNRAHMMKKTPNERKKKKPQ